MTFKKILAQLKVISNKYDLISNENKINLLSQLGDKTIPLNRSLIEYHNLLLFIIAHPSNVQTLNLAESELKRLAATFKKTSKKELLKFENSGLPFTKTLSVFSHDLLKWLYENKHISLSIDSFYNSTISLNDALQCTLPSLEKEIAGIGYNTNELFKALKLRKEERFFFLIKEFEKLNGQPFIKDYFFNGLSMYVKLQPANAKFSKAYNRIAITGHYFHSDNLKQFNQVELLNRKLPAQKGMSKPFFKEVIDVIKNSLTLLQRETDPVTYMDVRSFRLYELERGISIAIYGMTADRQLPLESYVGYTLFKNGLPAAYGGGWVFGKRTLFGINIFEPYRGGESGYMMCQLLRVYRQAFAVDYFEVEPYQYGLGNPEGISSGAYWFYYRFGFRSLDKELNQLSLNEFEKIQAGKGYRSSAETLTRFTESNVALKMGKTIPLTVAEVREKVTDLISKKHNGNRIEAEKDLMENFLKKISKQRVLSKEQKKVLSEIAFFGEAMKFSSPTKIKVMHEMILAKPFDLYKYQELLVKLLN